MIRGSKCWRFYTPTNIRRPSSMISFTMRNDRKKRINDGLWCLHQMTEEEIIEVIGVGAEAVVDTIMEQLIMTTCFKGIALILDTGTTIFVSRIILSWIRHCPCELLSVRSQKSKLGPLWRIFCCGGWMVEIISKKKIIVKSAFPPSTATPAPTNTKLTLFTP